VVKTVKELLLYNHPRMPKYRLTLRNVYIHLVYVPQKAKDEVTEACVSICCKDIRPFDIVTGSGFVDYLQSLIKIGSLHGNLNVKDLLLHPTTTFRNTRKDDYKHISYTTLTLHYIDDNWKLWSKVLFTCDSSTIVKLPIMSEWN
jgi:hypothetical protein